MSEIFSSNEDVFPTFLINVLSSGKLGSVDIFNIYWKYYPKYRSSEKNYSSLREFIEWFPQQSENNIQLLHKYDYVKTLNIINNYLQTHTDI